ncbi:MAG: NB-ARC domain-containing protein [Limnospira maxima]|uniref:NB-ARC domain-containing protein n=1 Tax=Limnospira indica PCC 8005 TaxID=376219 RepID=A0A9P1KBD5_9CYAN|nr:NB-ARC domain-containing protein [Limnospira indica]CDM92457.1 conserved hypothetical protein [Limnospira indica PCC 8005]
MTITELLKAVDRLVEKQRGKHLNDFEKVVIKGLWSGQTYSEIAEECGYHQNHVGDVSRQLFKILSQELEEDINKYNFCWTIERVVTSRQFVIGLFNSNITWCNPHTLDDVNLSGSSQLNGDIETNYHDLHLAPKIVKFCDRTEELKTLSNWVLNENIPLISVLGLPGIGKTSLVKRFIDLNIDKFDAVIWKSLKIQPALDHNITSILTKMGYVNPNLSENETPLCQLLNSSILRAKKCLIILDDVQEIFNLGVFSGQYKTEHQGYQDLFRRIAETSHQSHFILLSQESSPDMLGYNDDFAIAKFLQLQGLKSINFLSDRGLKDKESWSKLIHLYEGHPGYLKDIAQLIKDIFAGKVSDFLAEPEIILTVEINRNLAVMLQRLSVIEQQILMQLSQTDQPRSRNDLKQSLSLSLTDLINGLQSLNRRHLIQITDEKTMLFNVSKVVRQYVRYCGSK